MNPHFRSLFKQPFITRCMACESQTQPKSGLGARMILPAFNLHVDLMLFHLLNSSQDLFTLTIGETQVLANSHTKDQCHMAGRFLL